MNCALIGWNLIYRKNGILREIWPILNDFAGIKNDGEIKKAALFGAAFSERIKSLLIP